MAGPSAPGSLRRVRDSDLVDARGGDRHDVRRSDGVRGVELGSEALDQGGETETYVKGSLFRRSFVMFPPAFGVTLAVG